MADDQRSVPEDRDGGSRAADGLVKTEPKRPSFLRRHPVWVLLGLVAIVLVAVAGYFYWLVAVHPYETTDDAFIDSRQFAVASKVAGYVAAVPVSDNQHVVAGDVLLRIDPTDYRIALDQAGAQVEAAKAQVRSGDAQIEAQNAAVEEQKAQLREADAALQYARSEAARYQQLAQSGTSTVAQAQQATSNLQQSQAAFARAQAAVAAAVKQVGQAKAQRESAVASQREAETQLEQAQQNLDDATITAAQPGRVVRLSGAVGQYAEAGQALAMFVPDDIWVTANFKETQIEDMRPGQAVDIRIDAYPDHEIRGHVDSIQPGSGTAFSLLPAENATGNYVKVVQRVPVKIVADGWPDDVSIGPGMSVVPIVTVRPREGG